MQRVPQTPMHAVAANLCGEVLQLADRCHRREPKQPQTSLGELGARICIMGGAAVDVCKQTIYELRALNFFEPSIIPAVLVAAQSELLSQYAGITATVPSMVSTMSFPRLSQRARPRTCIQGICPLACAPC